MRSWPTAVHRCALALGFLVLASAFDLSAQTTAPVVVDAASAHAHVGEYVTVRGRVANVFTSAKGNTFLNFGEPYPRQVFSAVIFAGSAEQFPNVKRLEGRNAFVTGRVKLYKGKPEIVLSTSAQLTAE